MAVSEIAVPNPSQALDNVIGQTQPLDERVEQKALGQEDFFKLLTTQLASQDPLSPMEDTAFIAQMANFSELEMISQLNDNFSNFTRAQDFLSAQGMIGKNVTMLIDGREISGVADSVELIDGTIRVFVDDVGYNIENVFRIENTDQGQSESTSVSPATVEELADALVQTVQNSVGPENTSLEKPVDEGVTTTTSKQVEAEVNP